MSIAHNLTYDPISRKSGYIVQWEADGQTWGTWHRSISGAAKEAAKHTSKAFRILSDDHTERVYL